MSEMTPDRVALLQSLKRATFRQYERERSPMYGMDGPRPLKGTREGVAPSSVNAAPKPKASPRLTTSARDVPTHMARAPKRPYCADGCDTIAVRGLWAYECGRNPRHSLTTRVRAPKSRTTTYANAKRATTSRATHGNDHANLATQVWVPTPYEMAQGAKRVASRAL